MTRFERAQRVVAAAYARRFADRSTVELLASLERANDALRASIVAKEKTGHTRTGRYVFGLTISASIMSVGIALFVYWYQYTVEGSCFREGFDRGYHRGTVARRMSVPCQRHGGAIVPGPRGSTPNDGAHSAQAKIAEVRR